jgi:hypothetical protein
MELVLVLLLGIAAVSAVFYPLVRRGSADPVTSPSARGRAAGGTAPQEDDQAFHSRLEAEVARYRQAIRAGALCRRCHEANPRGSRFCAECGRRL